MLSKSELAVESLSRENVTIFYKIVREELEKENITWEMFCGATIIAQVRRARHKIVWRIYNEMSVRLKTIGELVNLSPKTVQRIIRNMESTEGKFVNKIANKKESFFAESRT